MPGYESPSACRTVVLVSSRIGRICTALRIKLLGGLIKSTIAHLNSSFNSSCRVSHILHTHVMFSKTIGIILLGVSKYQDLKTSWLSLMDCCSSVSFGAFAAPAGQVTGRGCQSLKGGGCICNVAETSEEQTI